MAPEDFKFIKPGEVRVRIAPSPTGPLHIGTARASLFNFLFAEKYQGSFILRIEDTDVERSDQKWEKDILDNLKWLGIEWSEGPDIGGNYGPYRQSERLPSYKKYIEKLLTENKAYYCFCSEEELEARRQYQMSIGQPPIYDGKCRNLSSETVKQWLSEGKASIIRFKASQKKLGFEDLIRGKVEFDTSLIGDFAIAKNLNTPLYNFAVVIDDFEMKISHVIRGEDHISNTPKQILIQEALDFPQPKYGHLPLVLGTDRSKLSKRHEATAVSIYRKAGYLPESLVNFMAFLGWNPGGEREIYSLPSLIKEFSLEGIQKGGAIFNIKRLDFLNGFYIRQRSAEKITELCLPYLIETGLIEPIFESKELMGLAGMNREIVQKYLISETKEEISLETLKKIISLYQERLKKLSEISELTEFFFKDKLEYDRDLLKWGRADDKGIKSSLDKLEKILHRIELGDWTKENLENVLLPEAAKAGLPADSAFVAEATSAKEAALAKAGDRGYLLWPFRVALTGEKASAGPFEIAEILGKEKTLKRIKEALYKISL